MMQVDQQWIGVIDKLQQSLVYVFVDGFASVSVYALNLFYIIAGIELALLGLFWALRQDDTIALLIGKLIKIGFIFFLISQLPMLMNVLIGGFAFIVNKLIPTAQLNEAISQPSIIFKLVIKDILLVLQSAVHYGSYNFSLSLLYFCLSFGSFILLGLIIAQLMVYVVSFWAIGLMALLLLPFSILKPSQDYLNTCTRNLMKMGVRLGIFMVILGVGMVLFKEVDFGSLGLADTIEAPLLLFFLLMIITILLYRVPSYASDVVGRIAFAPDIKSTPSAVEPSGGAVLHAANQSVMVDSSAPSSPASMVAATTVHQGNAPLAAPPAAGVVNVEKGMQDKYLNIDSGDMKKMGQAISKQTLKQLNQNFNKGKSDG